MANNLKWKWTVVVLIAMLVFIVYVVLHTMLYNPWKAVVLTLPRLSHRTEPLMVQLKQRGIPSEIVYGVDGKEMVENSDDEEKKRLVETYGTLRVGEIGCTMSHMSLWRKIAAMPDRAKILIFEDDADFCGPPIVLPDVPYDFIYYGYLANFGFEKRRSPAFVRTFGHAGTHTYHVTPEGARKILQEYKANPKLLRQPVDLALMTLFEERQDRFIVYSQHPRATHQRGEATSVQTSEQVE